MSDLGQDLDDQDDGRSRSRQIVVWAVVSGVVLVAAVALIVAFLVGGSGSPEPVASGSASPTQPVESPSPTGESSPTAEPSTPTATDPSATPTTPVASPTSGAGPATTDVFTPRLVWEPSTSAIEGAAVMGSIVEQGGTCTIVAERGGESVESEAFPAQADAQSTVCGSLALSSDRLTAGDWQVHVHYESPDAMGDSDATTVAVSG